MHPLDPDISTTFHLTAYPSLAVREIKLFKMFRTASHICTLINSNCSDTAFTTACVLEFLEHGTLQDLLDSGDVEWTVRNAADVAAGCTRLKFDRMVAATKDVLTGLEAMHQADVVHCDLKPDNIGVAFMPAFNRVGCKIIDLGIALYEKSDRASAAAPPPAVHRMSSAVNVGSHDDGFTGLRTSVVSLKLPRGTLLYMSPEQLDPERVVDRRSDVFSLGVTIHKCLTGRFPFVQPRHDLTEERLALQLFKTFVKEAPAPALVIPDATVEDEWRDAMGEIVAKALQIDAGARYTGAEEMKRSILTIERSIAERSKIYPSLTLCGFNPNANLLLHATVPVSARTLNSSNFMTLYDMLPTNIPVYVLLRAVEELIRCHASRAGGSAWAKSFISALNEAIGPLCFD